MPGVVPLRFLMALIQVYQKKGWTIPKSLGASFRLWLNEYRNWDMIKYLSNFKYTSLGYDQIWICFMVTSWLEHETFLNLALETSTLGNDYHRRQVDHSDQLDQQNGGIAWQNFCFNQQWNMYKKQNILILQYSSCSCFSHTHMLHGAGIFTNMCPNKITQSCR